MSRTQTWICQACGNEWTRQAIRGQVPKWCPDCRRADRRDKPCLRCGNPTASRSKYCSRNCLARARERPRELAVYIGNPQLNQRPQRPAAVTKRTKRRFTSGRCKYCESWFITTNAAHRTCSAECQAANQSDNVRAGKHRRRAVKMRAFVQNVHRKSVFERDGYRCHLCRRKADPTKRAPHPKAPTIDHVIPLAEGGTHEPLNCRTACFMCNSRKGSRGGGEQLLLIA